MLRYHPPQGPSPYSWSFCRCILPAAIPSVCLHEAIPIQLPLCFMKHRVACATNPFERTFRSSWVTKENSTNNYGFIQMELWASTVPITDPKMVRTTIRLQIHKTICLLHRPKSMVKVFSYARPAAMLQSNTRLAVKLPHNSVFVGL